MYTKEELDLIVLDGLAPLTYKTKYKLLDGLENTFPNFEKYEPELIKMLGDGVYNKLRENFCDNSYRDKYMRELAKKGIRAITYFSPLYPKELSYLPLPPLVLYCKGNVELLSTDKFAVVGSRRATPEVMAQSERFAFALSKSITIVTGIADGVDTSVINGAIDGGKLICVLAHGFDHVFPSVNAHLLDKVVEKGLVITEFIPSVQARNFTFPIRNRIIAGLSRGVLITSAGKKSGALITAEYALEYGKDVFAFPYGIGVPSGEGCNALIKRGATLCDDVRDIQTTYGFDQVNENKKVLNDEEERIVKILKENGAMHVEQVAQKLNVQTFQIAVVISMLELKGAIVKIGGNRISAV